MKKNHDEDPVVDKFNVVISQASFRCDDEYSWIQRGFCAVF